MLNNLLKHTCCAVINKGHVSCHASDTDEDRLAVTVLGMDGR